MTKHLCCYINKIHWSCVEALLSYSFVTLNFATSSANADADGFGANIFNDDQNIECTSATRLIKSEVAGDGTNDEVGDGGLSPNKILTHAAADAEMESRL